MPAVKTIAPQWTCSRSISPRRAGTAEIELVLAVMVLVTLLMLTLGAMRIAVARLDTANEAQFEAFQDATAAATPRHADGSDLEPLPGVGQFRPGLANRTHVVRPTTQVVVSAGNRESISAEVGGRAGLPSPAWTYWAFPVGGDDRATTAGWFEEHADESHGPLADPLRLAPSWKP